MGWSGDKLWLNFVIVLLYFGCFDLLIVLAYLLLFVCIHVQWFVLFCGLWVFIVVAVYRY